MMLRLLGPTISVLLLIGTGPRPATGQQNPPSMPAAAPTLRMNAHYIAPPAEGQSRDAWLQALRDHRERTRAGLDLRIYDRQDLQWLRGAFTCHFTFMFDRSFYDPETNEYTIDSFLEDGRQAFGGYDALVLWQGYPRLGVDERNQFDMYRDMPGGLKGLGEVVDKLHRAGVKVFIDYNPWDTGTRREPRSDDEALADLVSALGADGIFLDTMAVAPAGLRKTIDDARPGVAFVPEVHPDQAQLALCSGSWGQWLDDRWPPGLLHLKWIEPAHMQYQIRRWNLGHTDEIRTAFFNGSGIMVWENVFGSWNDWTEADQACWRRASDILRRFPEHFAGRDWEPFYPCSSRNVFVHRWPGAELTLFTYLDLSGDDPPPRPRSIEIPASQAGQCFDLWRGGEITTRSEGDRVRIELPPGEMGCVAVAPDPASVAQLGAIQRTLIVENIRHGVGRGAAHVRRITRDNPAERTIPSSHPPPGMVLVSGTHFNMKIAHPRRECGCYLDPGAAEETGKDFRWGDPHWQEIQHDIHVDVKPFFIDACEVTNAEYRRFLDATGYRPKHAERFLAHWQEGRIPAGLEDHPVVYVDIDDARAYAAWAGKRIPTEAEWQLAAQSTDGRQWPWGNWFDASRCNITGDRTMPVRSLPEGRSPAGCYHMAGNVWEWTDSEYEDGHTRFIMIRGGGYFDAPTSGWYLRGGPQPCGHHAKFIRMWPGLDRCATVGFRCAASAAE